MINSNTSAWIHLQKFTMSPLIDMWMSRRKKQKRDHKGPLFKELNQRKYGFLNFLLKKCIPKHLMKNKKLYGFQNLFWRTWILKKNQSWDLSFQRLPFHFLPNIFLKRFQNLTLHFPPTLFHHLIHLNLILFHLYFLYHSTTLQGVCQCWSFPLFLLPLHITFNTLSTPPSILPPFILPSHLPHL